MPYKFYIQDLYTTTEITEPDGWANLESVLERDFSTHGMFFHYTGGDLKLGFACDGKTELEAEYQTNGPEGYYQFLVEFAIDDFSSYSNIFTGDIDFSTRKFDEDMWEAEVNQSTTELKIKNRSGIKTNLNKQLTIDGNPISNINYDDSIISLATKELKQIIATNDGQVLESIQSTGGSSSSFLFGTVGYLEVTNDELGKFSNVKTQISKSDVSSDFLILENDAAMDINFDFDIDFDLTEDQGSTTTSYQVLMYLAADKPFINELGAIVSEINLAVAFDSSSSPNDVTLSLVDDITVYASAPIGTRFKVYFTITQLSSGSTQMSCDMTVNKFDLTITDKKGITGTQSQWYHLHDVLNKNLNFITNEYDFLYSDLLGDQKRGYDADSCLHNLRITNGFRVRQLNDTNKAIETSFKEFISNINGIYAVGYGIEDIDSPTGLGIFEITTFTMSVYYEFRIEIDGDMTPYYQTGDSAGFFDNEVLYGTWPVTSISYDDGLEVTEIIFNVAGNSNLDQIGATTLNAYLTTDRTTSTRERLRVEKWEHFYGENELIDLGVVEEYTEEPFNEAIYNEIKIGFEKYSNDEDKPTTLEEIHTKSVWSMPISKSEKSLNLLLSWIGSTFLFNESRSKIFSKKPTTSHKLDNDIFFCEKAAKEGTYTVDFDDSNFIVMPADAYENVINGSQYFAISNAVTPGNNGTYQIDSSIDTIFQIDDNKYKVFVTSVSATDSADEVFIEHEADTQLFYKPETIENLTSSSGITRSTYIMNQRRTIKRFLIRWGSFIRSSLAYLADLSAVTIQNNSFVNNGSFASELNTSNLSNECLAGDTSGASIQEDAIINTDSFESAKFKPNVINATVRLCDSDYELIYDAHRNNAADPNLNYGYITVTSPRDGNSKSGWLLRMKRSPTKKIAVLTLLEKA